MIDIRVVDGWYVIQASKCTLTLTRTQFITALKQGKWWPRRQALQARLAAAADREEEEAPHGTHH